MDLRYLLNDAPTRPTMTVSTTTTHSDFTFHPAPAPDQQPQQQHSGQEGDPYAAAFLRHELGADKWATFSTKLFERRLGGPRSRSPKARLNKPAGASAVDFLHKVEIVKELLRNYVPHPYNPVKSLSHPCAQAPSGQVTLTRSTILALCGWSNTQFSYWARRSEAVSVLAHHDHRLLAVASVLERRIRAQNPSSSNSPFRYSATAGDTASAIADTVTGKGLDQIVDSVKQRTGASQFLRGKHSSLDAFGAPPDQKTPEHHRPLHLTSGFSTPSLSSSAQLEPSPTLRRRSFAASHSPAPLPSHSLPSLSHVVAYRHRPPSRPSSVGKIITDPHLPSRPQLHRPSTWSSGTVPNSRFSHHHNSDASPTSHSTCSSPPPFRSPPPTFTALSPVASTASTVSSTGSPAFSSGYGWSPRSDHHEDYAEPRSAILKRRRSSVFDLMDVANEDEACYSHKRTRFEDNDVCVNL